MTHINNLVLSLLCATFVTFSINSQKLGRRASWQAQISGPSIGQPGAVIKSITENSPLEKLGLESRIS